MHLLHVLSYENNNFFAFVSPQLHEYFLIYASSIVNAGVIFRIFAASDYKSAFDEQI